MTICLIASSLAFVACGIEWFDEPEKMGLITTHGKLSCRADHYLLQ
jgi:hypothetical protein